MQITARVYSVDGPNCVDLSQSYHHRSRWQSIEHHASLSFAVQAPLYCGASTNRNTCGGVMTTAWNVGMRECTGTEHFVYAERRTFGLKLSSIKAMRAALFSSATGAALGDKLSDYEMMLWLTAAVGVDVAGCGMPGMRGAPSCWVLLRCGVRGVMLAKN